jgi:HSP20 family protein
MQEDMDRIFNQFFGGQSGSGRDLEQGQPQTGMQQWAPSVDVSQTDREYCIEAELPGVKPDDIDVQVRDHHLVLRAEMRQEEQPRDAQAQAAAGQRDWQGAEGTQGPQRQYVHRERRSGYLQRVFPLPESVDEENITCSFEHGVLTIHVPKMEPAREQSRRIPISGAATPSGRGNGRAESRESAMAGRKGGETDTQPAGAQGTGTPEAQPPDQKRRGTS